MRSYTAVVATAERYQLAEGPLWDRERRRVLFVDILARALFEADFDERALTVRRRLGFDTMVSAVVSAADGTLLVATTDELVVVAPNGHRSPIARVVPEGTASRCNDGAVDPEGRLLIGTLALDDRTDEEQLLRLENDGTLTCLDSDLSLSNGLAWSETGEVLYNVDTFKHLIYARPYAPDTIGPREVFVRVQDGYPDGLAVDTHGNVWVAIWGSGLVRCYAPDGSLIAVVEVAAPYVSSVAFIGDDLATLLITTARDRATVEELIRWPESGCLFRADVEAVGVPTTPWNGRVPRE